MTNKEKMIKGMKLLKEGCENIYSCNPIDCPLYAETHRGQKRAKQTPPECVKPT